MLPKVTYPYYETIIPSTGKKVKFRPYNVAEENILLVAVESGDVDQFKIALKQIISNCVEDCPDVDKLSTFDVDDLFVKLRSKSVSEVLELNVRLYNCEESPNGLCNTSNKVTVKLDDIKLKVAGPDGDVQFDTLKFKSTKTIKFNDNLGVKLRYPSYKDFDIVKTLLDENSTEEDIGFEMLARCTVSLFDGDTVYDSAENSIEDIISWYKQIPKSQLTEVDAFFKLIPELSYSCIVTCKKCKKEVPYKIKGIDSFFA